MWSETASVFQSELGPNERLLWSGRPKQGFTLRAFDLFLIPFSLLWGGFAIFWEVGVITSGAPFFFWLWGIPFVLVGIYFIVGRFFVEALQRTKIYYALTNERVMIMSGLITRSVKSLNLLTLSEINITQKRDGTGTITFGPSYPMSGMYRSSSWPGMNSYAEPAFEAIKRVREVHDQIREAQRKVLNHDLAASNAGSQL